MVTDDALVDRARAGDRGAFGALVERHGPRIHGLVRRMLRGDREEAEDLTQEVFLRAWEALPRFRGESAFSTWLHRIAVNRTLHRLEKRRVPTRSLDDACFEVPDRREEPAALAGSSELGRALAEALERLPAPSRAVFLLREAQGLSHDEIAAILGSTAAAVRVRLHRARKDLARLLAPWLEVSAP